MPDLILASSSLYRRQLLGRLGLAFRAISPGIDESPLPQETPQHLAKRLAEEKAQAVANHLETGLVIGSDQVACLDGETLAKPGNHQRAHQQLTRCSGQSVTFYTGLCLFNTESNKQQSTVVPFTVSFRQLSSPMIEQYLLLEQPYDCAGSFKVEGLGISLFSKLEGDDPNSLIGLPLIRLVDFLANEGVSPLAPPAG